MLSPTSPNSPAFGPDKSPIDYSAIASLIRDMDPRALTNDKLADVLTMIEYLQRETMRVHDGNAQRAAELDRKDQALAERERALALRSRAVDAVLRHAQPRWFVFFRRNRAG
jgi:hypothetical protein